MLGGTYLPPCLTAAAGAAAPALAAGAPGSSAFFLSPSRESYTADRNKAWLIRRNITIVTVFFHKSSVKTTYWSNYWYQMTGEMIHCDKFKQTVSCHAGYLLSHFCWMPNGQVSFQGTLLLKVNKQFYMFQLAPSHANETTDYYTMKDTHLYWAKRIFVWTFRCPVVALTYTTRHQFLTFQFGQWIFFWLLVLIL